MAEGDVKSQETILQSVETLSSLECAICLQTCIHPAVLPCGHIFCFLCIKGIAFQSGRCAMCRETIPADFLHKPRLITPIEMDSSEDEYNWYYEGYSGWWQYDQRANTEIEEAFHKGERSCRLLLAGSLYVVDFNTMVQYRQTNPVRRRRIKRDRATTDKLGVAGLRADIETGTTEDGDNNAAQSAQAAQSLRDEEVEIRLQRLWLTSSDGLDYLQRQIVDIDQLETIGGTNNAQRGLQEFSVSGNRFAIQRQDSDLQGLESLGPEECPDDFTSFRSISPTPRDGRTFNPRLELGDGGEDDTDDEEEEEDEGPDDGPTTIFSGPTTVSSAALRPLPMRARGQEANGDSLESSGDE